MKWQWWMAFLLLLSSVPAVMAGDVKTMPLELVDAARKHNCAPIEDFFSTSAIIHPPFLYGYVPGNEQKSAVFWCERTNDTGERRYFLVFEFKIDHELARCPHEIEHTSGYPGGLLIFQRYSQYDRFYKRDTLEKFAYVRDPQRSGPRGVRLRHPAILSYKDGTGTIYYCHQGEWLERYFH